MRTLLYTAILLLACNTVFGQSTNENYVKTTTYQVETTDGVHKASTSQDLEENDRLTRIGYFDGLGRSKQNIALRAGGQASLELANELTYDWEEGDYTTPFFYRYGSVTENEIITGTTPYGDTDLVWECHNEDDNTVPANRADGGWNTAWFPIDKTVGYRYTVWVKRSGGSISDGRTYHGTRNVSNLSNEPQSNPYFWHGFLPQLDTWYFMVGVIHPQGYTGTDTGESGVYDMQGNKVLNGTEFKWNKTSSTSRFRDYLYFAEGTDVKQYFYKPLLETLDGSELPVATLIENTVIKDIVTPVTYDAYGRQDKEYLPDARVSAGLFTDNATVISNLSDYYANAYTEDTFQDGSINAYSEKEFEASPLNRVLKQAAPGADWAMGNDHEMETDYLTNVGGEVRHFTVSLTFSNNTYTPSLVDNGDYLSGQVYKSIARDENHTDNTQNNNTVEEFKDAEGRVILKRTYENNIEHDTYYVYDDHGNLSYVLPPLMNAGTETLANIQAKMDDLAYQYVYDHRNRLVEKKLPGKGWEYIVYNLLDQPVMTQDQNLKAQDKWLFTKYDAFGRVVYTGFKSSTGSRLTFQNFINDNPNVPQYESKVTSGTGAMNTYYTSDAVPATVTEIYTINYYDDYAFDLSNGTSETAYGVTPTDRTKSLATGTKVRVLDTNHWITTVTYYDAKARPIYVYSHNPYLGTTDKLKSQLAFNGTVIETTKEHARTNFNTITTVDAFEYDHMNRLTKQTQTIDGMSEVIVQNSYDQFGRVESKGVGGLEGQPRLQDVDYRYNIRGWLKQINDIDDIDVDLFAFEINYNHKEMGSDNSNLYNGNISETVWKTANDPANTIRGYAYKYDALNRITYADHGIKTTGNFNFNKGYDMEVISYDKNGNIEQLRRYMAPGDMIDKIIYDYDSSDQSNRLMSATDLATSSNAHEGFKDGTNTGNDYTYDANGNMTSDANKQINNILYNHLNLPTQVEIDDDNGYAGVIKYTYDALGTKLAKTVEDDNSGNITTTQYAGNYIYKDTGSGAVLEFFSHPEGYAEPNGSNYEYVYQYKDHLGNIRLSYKDINRNIGGGISLQVQEENNYYPFGLKHKGYNNTPIGPDHPYGYNGKEENDELGLEWLDFGARNYDASIGRWMNLDPLAEKYYEYSSYIYTMNNPIFFIDPDGKEVKNGETARRKRHEKTVASGEKLFKKEYNGNENMKRRNFEGDDGAWKTYKTRRSNLKKARKNLKKSIKKEAKIDKAINDFKNTDPLGFFVADNLTYVDSKGNTQDLHVTIYSEASSVVGNIPLSNDGGAITELSQNADTGIFEVQTTINFNNIKLPSNKLAHELGHAFTYSKDPVKASLLIDETHDCQLRKNRNSYQSKDAIDWQERYDRNRKLYPNGNPLFFLLLF